MRQINKCQRCGGKLIKVDFSFRCEFCDAVYEEEKALDMQDEINKALDNIKQEKVANLRQRLWEATHEKYLSKEKITSIAREIRNYLPDDILANFYEIANSENDEDLNNFLNNLDVKEDVYIIDIILDYMLITLNLTNLLPLNNLIENTYKDTDLKIYDKYMTLLSNKATEIESGIYELNTERNVFIAYSSKDMKYVEELVKKLDENNITSFVAMRNLRHGAGAKENYEKNLEKAIDNCQIFLLISSKNSRNINCDAFSKEIPYVIKRDKLNAPAEYKNNYSKMPPKYKKPRIQLIVGEKPTDNVADKIVGDFFNGFEWRYNYDEVVDSIYNILMESPEEEENEQLNEIKEMISSLKNEFSASAKDSNNYNDFKYSDDDKTIVKYEGFNNVVEIPDGVTKIANQAFLKNHIITEIIMPDSVKEIGAFAFSSCEKLEKIRLSNNLETIGEYCFVGCFKLKNIYLPKTLINIGESAFSGLSNMTINCDLEKTPATWDKNWAGDTNLPKIIFKKVQKPKEKFILAGNNKEIVEYTDDEDVIEIPDGITEIKDYAFSNKSFSKIILPKSLRWIKKYAFSGCKNLKTVEFLGTFKDWLYLRFNDPIKYENLFIDGKKLNKRLVIKYSGVNGRRDISDEPGILSDNKFAGRDEIETVIFGGFEIGTRGFENCKSLTNFKFDTKTEVIGNNAFYGCSNLKEIYLLDVKTIGDNAFDTKSKLDIYTNFKTKPKDWSDNWLGDNKDVTVHWGYDDFSKHNDKECFDWLNESDLLQDFLGEDKNIFNIINLNHDDLISKKLEKNRDKKNQMVERMMEIKKSGLKQNYSNFSDCIAFEEVYHYYDPFFGDDSKLDFNSNHYYIDNGEFFMYDGTSDSLMIPKEARTIVKRAFGGSNLIRQVYFENDKLEEIGEQAFANCERLNQIVIPKGTKVGKAAFANCKNVKIYCEDFAFEDKTAPLNFDSEWLEGNSMDNVIWGFDWSKIKK